VRCTENIRYDSSQRKEQIKDMLITQRTIKWYFRNHKWIIPTTIRTHRVRLLIGRNLLSLANPGKQKSQPYLGELRARPAPTACPPVGLPLHGPTSCQVQMASVWPCCHISPSSTVSRHGCPGTDEWSARSGRDETPFDLMGSPQAHASRVVPGKDAVSCPPYVEGVERAGSLPAQWTLAAQGALFPCACCVVAAPPACGAGDTLPLCRLLGREKGGAGVRTVHAPAQRPYLAVSSRRRPQSGGRTSTTTRSERARARRSSCPHSPYSGALPPLLLLLTRVRFPLPRVRFPFVHPFLWRDG